MAEKPSSDQLRKATVNDYLAAQSRPNGNGIKGFFKSSLFASLLVFCLTQAVLVGASYISMSTRVSTMEKWAGTMEGTVTQMNASGTRYSHDRLIELSKDVAINSDNIKEIKKDTDHLDVLESEHRDLKKQMDELKNGKR